MVKSKRAVLLLLFAVFLMSFSGCSCIRKEIPANQKNLKKFNVDFAQSVTYLLQVTTVDNKKGYATAVALNSNGKLITAYHNIERYKDIAVVSHNEKKYHPRVGKISVENDLAYLYIDAKKISYVKKANLVKLAQSVYMLGAKDFLLHGMIVNDKSGNIIVDFEARRGMSGGGIFNDNGELVAILLDKDALNHTTHGVTPKLFDTINQPFHQKLDLQPLQSNYDTSYCHNKKDIAIWKKYQKSLNPNIQELHALFIGLCQKVKNRDLTTDMAQAIFEKEKYRLLNQ